MLPRALPLVLVPVVAAVLGPPPPARAGGAPGPQCKTRGGPCRLVATLGALLRPPGAPLVAGGSDLAILANFGVLVTGDGRRTWQFVCEETFGRGALDRVQLHPDGRLLAPGGDGLYLSADGCGFSRAGGSVAGKLVWDVATDPATPSRVWALTADPRTLHVSTDGGRTFVERERFDAKLRLHRILIAPSDPKRMYVAGYGEKVAMAIVRSDDGGATFAIDDSGAGFSDPARAVDYLGVDPRAPDTLLVAVADPNTGDQIFRSTDGGRRWSHLLTLRSAELKTGFAFGPGESLFVAGRAPFEATGMPTAHLYVSRDAGRTWEVRPSGEAGPRYRCLAHDGERLYACADDDPGLDPFLLGTSRDEGKTWEPVVRLAQVKGAKSCAFETCAATAVWLCEAHGACGPEQMRPAPRDAGSIARRDGGAPDGDPAGGGGGGGCACGAAGTRGRAADSGAVWLLPMLLLAARVGRDDPRRGRRPS